MTDRLWLLPFGPDQIRLPTLHSPDSGGFLDSDPEIARGFVMPAQVAAILRLQNQHAIPVGKEAVFFFHRPGVGLEDELAAGKGGNEHDQGGLGQVEIGQQAVHQLELEGRGDEDVCLSSLRSNFEF